MFAGIVEATAKILSFEQTQNLARIWVHCPLEFTDLSRGDSVAVNGVCLTIEELRENTMRFAVGPETLRVTGWNSNFFSHSVLNLERSLPVSARIHGHLITGHVDGKGIVKMLERQGESLNMAVSIDPVLHKFLWQKGGCAVNGVSLTINKVEQDAVFFCLIPETLKRTNMGRLQIQDSVNVEVDWMARGLVHLVEMGRPTP